MNRTAIIACCALGVIAIASGIAVDYELAWVTIATFGLLCYATLILANRHLLPSDQRAHRLHWLTGAFVLHLALGWVEWTSAKLQSSDAPTYQTIASTIASGGTSARALAAGKEGYTDVLAVLYRITGAHVGIAIALNAFVFAATMLAVHDTTQRLFGTAAARLSLPIMVFWPSLAYWSAQVLREAGIMFFLAVAANLATRLSKRWSAKTLILLVADLGALGTFRNYTALTAGAGLAVALILSAENVQRRARRATVLLAGAALLVPLARDYTGFNAAFSANLAQIDNLRTVTARAGSSFDQGAHLNSIGAAIRFLPKGLPAVLVGPYPWTGHSLVQLLGVVDGLLWIGVVLICWRHRRFVLLTLPAAFILGAMALSAGNFGLIVRLREQVFVLIVPILAYSRRRRARPVAAGTVPLDLSRPPGGSASHRRSDHARPSPATYAWPKEPLQARHRPISQPPPPQMGAGPIG